MALQAVSDYIVYRFLNGQMHVFRPRTDLARVLLALAPLVGAALIAISRCEDYRHDVYDVTIGSLLGILIAYFSYRRYYPPLRSPRCDIPFPSRGDKSSRFWKDKQKEGHRTVAEEDMDDEGEEAIPLKKLQNNEERDLERGVR